MTDRELNASGHTDDCPGNSHQSCAYPQSSHVDIFCQGCHDWFDEPHILPNGTDIAWPGSWSRERARAWRAAHNLSPPGHMSAAGPHDSPDLINAASTAGTGMLPKIGQPSDDDMAPSS